ncbi:Vegetative protein 300 [Acholeplasma oculi]|uniref:Large ribosomal subunit protein uL10 n=1 Tax=Acholeplasma oculi TaxID=35623 RepID=A0A061AC11_9MOLU|nr:50S ribosomal protein L10 [Acholeplasma oculi]CDR31363.1 50S ribosomal protein L10 [Acholeplasma oculi]SKC39394.1 LSU ribosomal protein L10P [Acholeplasma oculi]SUT91768.1 Vegetative protein 300 [Acholeplasma oculi]
MNKAITRKIEEVNLLVDKLKMAKTVVVFEYKGLTVSNFTGLRIDLHKQNMEVKVYKNNITRRAASLAGFGELSESLVGPLAVAISYDDVVAVAKTVSEFAKKNKTVVIRSGVIEGEVVGVDAMVALANLPSRETLLTQLAAGLLMPVKELAVGLNMLTETQE